MANKSSGILPDGVKEKKDFAEACGGQEVPMDKSFENLTQKLSNKPAPGPAWNWYGVKNKKP